MLGKFCKTFYRQGSFDTVQHINFDAHQVSGKFKITSNLPAHGTQGTGYITALTLKILCMAADPIPTVASII